MLRTQLHIKAVNCFSPKGIITRAGHVMLHHKVYQNKLIQIKTPTKSWGFFM